MIVGKSTMPHTRSIHSKVKLDWTCTVCDASWPRHKEWCLHVTTPERTVSDDVKRELDALTKPLRVHIARCPLGWQDGRLIATRSTTDADVIAWLQRLSELVP